MGSKSSTANATSSTDNRLVTDNGAIGITGSNGATVNTLDGGAIDGAFEFAAETMAGANALSTYSLDGVFSLADKAFTIARDAAGAVTANSNASQALVAKAYENSADQNPLDSKLIGAGLVALLGAFIILRK